MDDMDPGQRGTDTGSRDTFLNQRGIRYRKDGRQSGSRGAFMKLYAPTGPEAVEGPYKLETAV